MWKVIKLIDEEFKDLNLPFHKFVGFMNDCNTSKEIEQIFIFFCE